MQYAVRQTVITWYHTDTTKPQRHAAKTIIPCIDRVDAINICTALDMVPPHRKGVNGKPDIERAYDVVGIVHTSKGKVVLSLGDIEDIVREYAAIDHE